MAAPARPGRPRVRDHPPARPRRLTTQDLRRLLRTVLDTGVLRTPVPVPAPAGFHLDTPAAVEPWPGREFTAADGRRATVSARGLQVGDVQVTWSSLVAAYVSGDRWSLVSRRGLRLDLRPGEFGAEFLAELRDRVPTSVRIDRVRTENEEAT